MQFRKCFKSFLILLLLVLMTCLISDIGVKAESVSINKKSLKLIKGQSYQLKINAARGKPEWSSNNKTVAVVSQNGRVTVKKKGVAIITGKIGEKNFFCNVTGYNVLSGNQAETAVAHFCKKQQGKFYYNKALKIGKQYIG